MMVSIYSIMYNKPCVIINAFIFFITVINNCMANLKMNCLRLLVSKYETYYN